MDVSVSNIFFGKNIRNEELAKNLSDLKDSFLTHKSDVRCESPEGYIALPDDVETIKRIVSVTKQKTENGLPKTVFVVGIGGANLATKAIYDALIGFGDAVRDSERRMIFLDTLDESVTEPVLLHIPTLENIEDFLVVVVSKSGSTIETIANTEFLLARLEDKFGDVSSRVVMVGSIHSELVKKAQEKNIITLYTPENLSDRFSAFSATTLVPLACFGFLFEDFLLGARNYRDTFFKKTTESLEETELVIQANRSGYSILDLFFFSPRLETLGKWQRQLIAESLAKTDDAGASHGITPIVSIGTTDLHSMHQLLLDGPKDKITHFITVTSQGGEALGDASAIDAGSRSITDRKPGEVTGVLRVSVEETYIKHDLPFISVEIENISLQTLGSYMMRAMLETQLIASAWNINPFNQPAVEEYKTRARELLDN